MFLRLELHVKGDSSTWNFNKHNLQIAEKKTKSIIASIDSVRYKLIINNKIIEPVTPIQYLWSSFTNNINADRETEHMLGKPADRET